MVVLDWERVYPPAEGRIVEINEKENTAIVFCMGSKFAFPLDKLKKK
jgi:hypothetical protein